MRPLLLLGLIALAVRPSFAHAVSAERPNIVVILADDMGAGDLRCLNPASKIPTPRLDELAAAGMSFSDAHSPSAVCTPTRYGLLTGRYCWRSRLKSGVLVGDSPALLEPGRPTIASFLRAHGYATAAVGKWHLGLGDGDTTDFDQPLRPGPLEAGFDRFFGIPASLDMPPYLYVRDDRPERPASEEVAASRHRRQGGEGFWRAGPIAPEFGFAGVLPRLAQEAIAHLEDFARDPRTPFFLYLPLTAPHTPWVPTDEFLGKSEAGHYGDFAHQVDHETGRVLDALDRLGLREDTLVVFTSDNGCHWPRGDVEKYGHDAHLGRRGQKADIHEGGHRVPFLVRWPGRVPAGSRCDHLLCLTDLYASFAGILDIPLSSAAADDSFDQSRAFLDPDHAPARDHVVHHSFDGTFALREGRWKAIFGLGSGGFTAPRSPKPEPGGPSGQLYDLSADPGEQHDLWAQRPQVVARLQARMQELEQRGSSRSFEVPPREPEPAPARRPNVVLLMADDQGWGDSSYNGHPRLQTPALDAMAQSGLCFHRFYAAAPVCSPTRASVLTGRHPGRCGIPGANSGHLPERTPNLATILKAQGYRTGHFGKWHLGTLSRDVIDSNRGGRPKQLAHHAPPWRRGFDICFSTEAKVPTYDPMVDPVNGGAYGTRYWSQDGRVVEQNLAGDDSRVVMDRVIPFVEEAVAADTPFLAVVWFHSPHLPVVEDPEHCAAYADVEDARRREYYACLGALDAQIGRLREELRRLGVAEDTMLWYCSDNGPEGNAQAPGRTGGLRGRKRSLREGGVRVPGLLEWPAGITRPRTVEQAAWTCDILPTVLDLLGLETDAAFPPDGESLRALIEGEDLERSRPLGFRSRKDWAWHEGDHKLFQSGTKPPELYDLRQDPGESQDLAAQQPQRVAAMRERAERWLEGVDADAAAVAAEARPARDGDAPNLVLVMVDDLGPEWIGSYGGEGARTPQIDRLAAEGTRFSCAYSMPKCTPTRATLLTGQYPFRHGWVNHWDVPRWGCGCHFDAQRNLAFPRLLREAGYATAIAGKWQISDFRVQPRALHDHGFDEWCVWTGFETGVPASKERYHEPYLFQGDASRTREGAFGPDVFTDFVVDFLRRTRDRPSFVYYPMVLTHGPMVAPPSDPGAEGHDRFRAMVEHTDRLMGRIRSALEEQGLAEDTILVFTTDNGSPGGITGRQEGREVAGGKGKARETGCRVPFVVWGPGRIPAGRVCAEPIDFSDLFPSFVELAGATLPEDAALDGHSLAPLLRGETERGPRDWVLAMGGGMAVLKDGWIVPAKEWAPRVIRGRRYKAWFEEGAATRLHDLSLDPTEATNLLEAELDEEAAAALAGFEAVIRAQPARDGTPRYQPLPAQEWDLYPEWIEAHEPPPVAAPTASADR